MHMLELAGCMSMCPCLTDCGCWLPCSCSQEPMFMHPGPAGASDSDANNSMAASPLVPMSQQVSSRLHVALQASWGVRDRT